MEEQKSQKDVEIINTISPHVKCYGRKAPYDHPMIYLAIDYNIGFISCPYCSRKFVLSKEGEGA